MIASITVAGLLTLTPLSTAGTQFGATLNGAQNVPPIPAVTATGTATLILNDAQTELSYHIEYDGLIGTETAAHIHNASFKENGPIAFPLRAGEPKDGVWEIPAGMVTELFAGRLYINIHTDVYITGEIRGNIMASVGTDASTWGRIKALYRVP